MPTHAGGAGPRAAARARHAKQQHRGGLGARRVCGGGIGGDMPFTLVPRDAIDFEANGAVLKGRG